MPHSSVLMIPFHPLQERYFFTTLPSSTKAHGRLQQRSLLCRMEELYFQNHDKMNTYGTFCAPCQRTDIPSGAKVLRAQLAFKVTLQNAPNYYELYTRMVVNGSSQIKGIDFDVPFSPTSAFDNIKMIIAIAAAENIIIYSLDMLNIFQTNIKEKPYERWPDHPLLGTPANELCIQ
eukprot:13107400-Ditylum_brightwellii.AAC.1